MELKDANNVKAELEMPYIDTELSPSLSFSHFQHVGCFVSTSRSLIFGPSARSLLHNVLSYTYSGPLHEPLSGFERL